MWYVNSVYGLEETNKNQGFILTMWYVNLVDSLLDAGVIACFILTMWYVNYSVIYFPYN